MKIRNLRDAPSETPDSIIECGDVKKNYRKKLPAQIWYIKTLWKNLAP